MINDYEYTQNTLLHLPKRYPDYASSLRCHGSRAPEHDAGEWEMNGNMALVELGNDLMCLEVLPAVLTLIE